MAKTGNVDKDYFSAYLSEKAKCDDVEGEEGATILVQLMLLLHRLPWASLMADA